MTRNLREEVDIAPYVERGVIDVADHAVRDNINTLLNGALGQCFITPYIALEKVRKVLAYYHIFFPKTTFLEGDRGVEVFEVNQFGSLSGMNDSGEVVTKVDSPYNIYFEYKMNDKGLYDVFCEIVTDEELDDLVDNVEDEINDEDVEDSREDKLDEEYKENDIVNYENRRHRVIYVHPDGRLNIVPSIKPKRPSYPSTVSPDKVEKLDESSESVDMAGPETGTKQYPGGPQPDMNCSIGHAVMAKIKKKKLEEDTKERDAAWEKILSKPKPKSTENPNPTRVSHFLDKLTGKKSISMVKEEDKKKVY